ncbi:MAG: hypothetical protein KME15_14685 [Drouetiella hepatica Uher 2000/2452]|jgi:hypothetical protein|uniref:Uncharacterized protein n=1 Tax=Drouetiella hepatica Uher 2000/2452 TaxID=904376 RepID=A0A951QDI4_9CYAN|nr:hypothetical protein [Drouetiella hepatica Uher 2000/2452]
MQITLEIPDDLASQIGSLEDQLPQILQLGLRELHAGAQVGFTGAAEVLEFLAALPSPEEIISLQPSETLQAQINSLLEKNRTQTLTVDEEQTWQQYQYLEHLVRIAKAQALIKLKQRAL